MISYKSIRVFFTLMFCFINVKAQNISMYFPHFGGKTYDFIIFQGGKKITVYQGVIPSDGKFMLNIPETYTPYTGMSRWLITGTREGGGLDMFIPGTHFSVSCTEAVPNNDNIIYSNNYNKVLNDLHRKQDGILNRYELMKRAVHIFSDQDENYMIFKKEFQKQIKNYDDFQKLLDNKTDYVKDFIRIVNVTRGIAPILTENQKEKANSINKYIINSLNWEYLYTSGHWNTVIDSWISIHTKVIKHPEIFVKEFNEIRFKLKSTQFYYDFIQRVKHTLTTEKEERYLKILEIN